MVVAAAVSLTACGAQAPSPTTSHSKLAHAVATAGGRARPYRLYTHCGIDEARIGDGFFEAVHPLSDGNGNPPAGWGNPYQLGSMTLVSPTQAVFRDNAGHEVVFRLRQGATSFRHICS
jgi:hypothetical protein